MREPLITLILKNTFFFYLLFVNFLCFSQEINIKTLEKNADRIFIENYYYSGKKEYGKFSIIFVYCYDGYYKLDDTYLNPDTIGYQRYFFNNMIKNIEKKVSTKIADERLSLDDFIKKYLKKGNNNNYNVLNTEKLFAPPNDILSILFAAQYNYDFLILGENNNLNLYLPKDYPKVNTETYKNAILMKFKKLFEKYILWW
jgi:hypothetical protein